MSAGCKVPIIKDDPTGPDPKLVFAAHSFVQDIIEKAKAEAARRLKAQNKKVSESISILYSFEKTNKAFY